MCAAEHGFDAKRARRRQVMAIAKVTEIISSSKQSFEDAVVKGIERADKTLSNVQGAWIAEQKVVVEKGKITEYRVTMRVTFVLKD
jgi:flavin-binding protein dodecin